MIQTDGYNNSIDPFVDGYMEQEEEWEREGLLDPAWEKQQKKVMIYYGTCLEINLWMGSVKWLVWYVLNSV